ncbi:MAG: 2-hydroxyacid dehydrogenase, partial [Duganella sp.]
MRICHRTNQETELSPTEKKPDVLQLNPILIPSINDKLNALYTVHRLFEQQDKTAYLAEHGALIRGVITGGHTGITRAMM